ncbi:MAG TPA: hypothetical protein GXZ47_05770 [Treponema sp.]|nr:hypothetical protein [Treponema sp.]
MKDSDFIEYFEKFIAECPEETFDPQQKYVVLGDLHAGNGGSRDDMARNREIVQTLLDRWYLKKDYMLILNGDVEDVNKFRYEAVRRAWPRLFELFFAFEKKGLLRKIIGNHDFPLLGIRDYPFDLLPGLVLRRNEDRLFIFHGHQASDRYVKYGKLSELLIRFLLKPLPIHNTGVSRDSRRRFLTERRVYQAVRSSGILGICGHTHRPMFESLSKFDNIRFSVESHLKEYGKADSKRKKKIEDDIQMLQKEMKNLSAADLKRRKTQSLYGDSPFLVPCLFNAGCTTGRHGITALEIENDSILLVYWTDGPNNRPYITGEALQVDVLDDRWHRYVLHREKIEHLFTRIRLLGGA